MDEAVAAATQGDECLDDFLPLLVHGDFGLNGELPPEFVEAVSGLAGPGKIERNLREHL